MSIAITNKYGSSIPNVKSIKFTLKNHVPYNKARHQVLQSTAIFEASRHIAADWLDISLTETTQAMHGSPVRSRVISVKLNKEQAEALVALIRGEFGI